MFLSVERLQIPAELLSNIKRLCKNPTFQAIFNDQKSTWQKQRTGIRQGCPLSPYLFILTMHVMFADVKGDFNDPLHNKTFQGINFQELLYADDTLIIAKSASTANAYLHLIEKESEYLDLKLNQDKCDYISFNNPRGRIRFRTGTAMKASNETTYLGAIITDTFLPCTGVQETHFSHHAKSQTPYFLEQNKL